MANVAEGPESLVGTKLGRCTIKKVIGSGGMGTVYLAKYGPTDQDVAVKVLSPHLSSDAEYVARFIREGKEAGKIDHPNVVKVIETDKQDGTYFIVMEYVRGKPLDEMLRDEKRLTFQKATRIIRDVAKGLEAAQSRGVIHRDIKPANILLDTKGVPKLSDFGLAKQAGTRKGLTVEGLFMGTPEYVSPEQAEGKKVDFRTDVYALGVTYYQLLSGKFPFMGQTDVEMAMKRLKEDPRPIQDAFPGVDARAIPIVDKMLKRELEQRYQTAKDVLSALNPLVQNDKPKKTLPPLPKTATVIGKLPVEVQKRLKATYAALLMLPSLVLFFLAGSVARGGATFGEAAASIVGQPVGLVVGALGAVALGWGLFVMRRELKTSSRGPVVIGLMAAAGACAWLALATIQRPVVEAGLSTVEESFKALWAVAMVASVNQMIFAVTIAVTMSWACFELDEESKWPALPVIGLALASGLWFAASTGGKLLEAVKALPQAMETAVPLLAGAVLACVVGVLMVAMRSAEVGTRRMGAGVMGLGWVGLMVAGAAAGASVLTEARKWAGAAWGLVKGLPAEFPRSGALAIVAVALAAAAIFVLRAGYAKTQAFYVPKKNGTR